jgi:hypothetical protein
MGDPVSLVVFTAVATKVVDRVMDVVLPEFKSASKKAQQEAIANAMTMVDGLRARLAIVEEAVGSAAEERQRVNDTYEGADFSYTLRQALLTAARTDSELRHEVLSRAVVERLIAASDSTQAVASALAVEALARLSAQHLDLLGLAALLYYIAPNVHGPAELAETFPHLSDQSRSAISLARIDAAREAVSAYLDWMRGVLEKHSVPPGISSLDFAHLVSASCASFDRTLHRDMRAILPGRDLHDRHEYELSSSYQQRLPLLLRTPGGQRLLSLWEDGLQHVTLTPAGLLIGTVVHEWKTTEAVQVNWQMAPADAYRDERAWDGRQINRDFYSAIKSRLESDLSQEIRSGKVMPWDLDR